ncbi:MAG: threonine--tRNA ligase [Verrucomicrobiales bacterium]|nr:threonine--tRNA ligase [Verrucomicrobiales bacterium]
MSSGNGDDRLSRMRHSAAHVLATAMLDLFPDAELGIGPSTDDGFYYDFQLPRALTPDDLQTLETSMQQHKDADYTFEYSEHRRNEALEYFKAHNQPFKVELINDLPNDETISYFTSGPFVDLCRGPHVDTTGDIGAFKLLSIAGAYWRGDEHRPQLQRVYGTTFETEDELTAHLDRLEEARRRDHRTLARDLDLFSINPSVGAGLVLWHPKGARIRELLETYWREEHRKRGYDMVYTPHIGRRELWETSGHTQWFADGLFPEMELEHQTFINKPMNCPFHVQIYGSQTRSYRDLPLRFGELGTVYRFERSGTLHGALRVRGLTQDDAHIFCRQDQFADEVSGALDLAKSVYATFGFNDYKVDLSVRDTAGDGKFVGSDDLWGLAEQGLIDALDRHDIPYDRVEGEAAFYGPKIDIQVADAIGRMWQLTTIQVDFNLPERFDISYEAEDGTRKRPVMVHRAIFGAMERFFAVLTEHFAGAFPVWLAPVQVVVVPIADRHGAYCTDVANRLIDAGLRVEIDQRAERMNRKIRDAQLQKIPYMLIAGDRDIEAEQVSVRLRTGGDMGGQSVDQFLASVLPIVESRDPVNLGFSA